MMSDERRRHIVDEVVARLQRRAQSTLILSGAPLREAVDSEALFCRHATLHLLRVDLSLLTRIAHADATDPAAAFIQDALAYGLRVQLSVARRLLPALPLRRLARLPLALRDEQGEIIHLHPGKLLGYADVAHLPGGVLLLPHRCVVTPLARETAARRHLQLIKQE